MDHYRSLIARNHEQPLTSRSLAHAHLLVRVRADCVAPICNQQVMATHAVTCFKPFHFNKSLLFVIEYESNLNDTQTKNNSVRWITRLVIR